MPVQRIYFVTREGRTLRWIEEGCLIPGLQFSLVRRRWCRELGITGYDIRQLWEASDLGDLWMDNISSLWEQYHQMGEQLNITVPL